MKHYINKEIISRFLAGTSRKYLENLSPIPLIIPYYHMVSNEKVLHICNLYQHKTTKEFAEDLDFLLKYFYPIGLGELLETLEKKSGFSRRCFHLTFDDGFREMKDVVAPILYGKGIPATFFINSAFTDNKNLCYQHKASILSEMVKEGLPVAISRDMMELLKKKGIFGVDLTTAIMSVPYEKKEVLDDLAVCMKMETDSYLEKCKPYLDSSQIRQLIEKGFTIGSHSIDHPLYSTICFEEQVRQTMESTRWVREKYGLKYGAFAFPHTDRNVEDRFYNEISGSGMVDIFFGTGGIKNNEISRHLQRFSLEKPVLPADRIIAMQYVRNLWRA